MVHGRATRIVATKEDPAQTLLIFLCCVVLVLSRRQCRLSALVEAQLPKRRCNANRFSAACGFEIKILLKVNEVDTTHQICYRHLIHHHHHQPGCLPYHQHGGESVLVVEQALPVHALCVSSAPRPLALTPQGTRDPGVPRCGGPIYRCWIHYELSLLTISATAVTATTTTATTTTATPTATDTTITATVNSGKAPTPPQGIEVLFAGGQDVTGRGEIPVGECSGPAYRQSQ